MSDLPYAQRLFARDVRWALGHALPRLATDRAARQGDLHGQLVALSGARVRTATPPTSNGG
ncbi:hypothetical protein O1L55_17995 [Streptomyces albulus]|nr:hypothetical protein [Streptomyces noursei]